MSVYQITRLCKEDCHRNRQDDMGVWYPVITFKSGQYYTLDVDRYGECTHRCKEFKDQVFLSDSHSSYLYKYFYTVEEERELKLKQILD